MKEWNLLHKKHFHSSRNKVPKVAFVINIKKNPFSHNTHTNQFVFLLKLKHAHIVLTAEEWLVAGDVAESPLSSAVGLESMV